MSGARCKRQPAYLVVIIRRCLRHAASLVVALAGLAGASVSAQQAVTLQRFDASSMAQIIKAHRGKPFIVHAWGVTCAPCIVELPRWAALMRDVGRAHVVFVQVEAAPDDRVERLLTRAGLARAEHWVLSPEDSAEALRDQIDPQWQGELPHTVLMTAEGQRAARLDHTEPAALRAWLAGRPGDVRPPVVAPAPRRPIMPVDSKAH